MSDSIFSDEFAYLLTDILKESYKDRLVDIIPNADWSSGKYHVIPGIDTCSHNWKEYIGFTDQYKYCDTCGIKHDPEKDIK